jgi:L-aspartate oxidase
VTAAAHYTIGGVATDRHGRTGRSGLWACGEVAATGLHGANRLASNSLMEALIFGTRAAHDIVAQLPGRRARGSIAPRVTIGLVADLAATLVPLRRSMSANVGVVRDAAGLQRAIDVADALARMPVCADPRVRDAVTVARVVAIAAYERCESRGAHFRRDFPLTDPRLAARSFVTLPAAPIAHTS